MKRYMILFGLLILSLLFSQWLPPTAYAISNEPERTRIAIAGFETMGGDIQFSTPKGMDAASRSSPPSPLKLTEDLLLTSYGLSF